MGYEVGIAFGLRMQFCLAITICVSGSDAYFPPHERRVTQSVKATILAFEHSGNSNSNEKRSNRGPLREPHLLLMSRRHKHRNPLEL